MSSDDEILKSIRGRLKELSPLVNEEYPKLIAADKALASVDNKDKRPRKTRSDKGKPRKKKGAK